MSYYNRRTDQGIPVLTAGTCILCGIIFLQLQSAHTWADTTRWGYYPESAIYEGKPWILVTSAFVHIELLHLLFNLYWLWILGGAFERTFGAARWLLFVFSTAFVSSGLQLATGESGIGLSGVGYALFGFGWMTRRRFPEFARIVDDRTVRVFVGWGILCVVLTKLEMMNVANAAHLGGFLIGATLGGFVERPKARVPLAIAAVLLVAGSIVPIYWNPLSSSWTSFQIRKAVRSHDDDRAIKLLNRYLESAEDEEEQVWALQILAGLHAVKGNDDAARAALAQLRRIDPKAAAKVESALAVTPKADEKK